ncbi:hypothetical protein WJX73_000928 [Symbiochloris irregularis]|uniref:Condensin complex subunit 2 n=1 Tax=Symbiochloris irregularis TaxID=706552 RepID=A0AAW1NR32_9CHLO
MVLTERSTNLLETDAARVASTPPGKRKSTLAGSYAEVSPVATLYSNCLKLASENKITSRNTWALPLIDHISDLVQPSGEEAATNFQRASVTLDAGVTIYAHRVDSVHVDMFRVLGGLSRGGNQQNTGDESQAPDQGDGDADDSSPSKQGGTNHKSKKAAHQLQDTDPNSTLEANLEALNAKKLDLAFAVDPLFHRTSAQFDAGGAKGLLLHNLSVFKGCEIAFDSNIIPDAGMTKPQGRYHQPTMIDLRSLQKQVNEALSCCAGSSPMSESATDDSSAPRICPALDELYARLGCLEAAREAAGEAAGLCQQAAGGLSAYDYGMPDSDNEGFDAAGVQAEDDDSAAPDDSAAQDDSAAMTQHAPFTQDFDASVTQQMSHDTQDASVDQWAMLDSAMSQGMSALQQKDWAGASHWRFRRVRQQQQQQQTEEVESQATAKPAARRRRRGDELIDFHNLPDMPEGLLDLARPQDIRLKGPATRAPTLLPQDTHYQAQQLTKFFLHPDKLILPQPRSRRDPSFADSDNNDNTIPDDDHDQNDYNDGGGMGDADESAGGFESGWGDMDFGGGSEEGNALVQAPTKVNKIAATYARSAQQVDVRALKEVMWDQLLAMDSASQSIPSSTHNDSSPDDSSPPPDQSSPKPTQGALTFQDLISALPADNAAGRAEDISVHLCFICLLHLANEHGLQLVSPSLDRLEISLVS